MLKIGDVNTVKVFAIKDKELIVKCDGENIIMPKSMAPSEYKVAQEISAFVFAGQKGDLMASSDIPYAVVGEYAFLKAINVEEFGAFFEWGMEKDLLVPGNMQKDKVKKFENYIVRICVEEETNRVFGSTKLGVHIENSQFDINEKDHVNIQVTQKTELGFRVIVNKKFIGMIYHNEIFQEVFVGQEYKAVVKKLRTDGLVDLALQKQGFSHIKDSKEKILQFLKENGGKSNLHDKSSPEEIKSQLGMSKKVFKNSIGMLYKDRKIIINKDGIELA